MATPHVKALLVLDGEGNRVCAKYYDKSYPTLKEQLELESNLYKKTKNMPTRLDAEIIMMENIVSVFKFGSDVIIYAVGSSNENELILASVLDGAYECLNSLLRGSLERNTMLDNLELVLLTFDEVVDGGIIMETDPLSISNRVTMKSVDSETPMQELTISQAFATAREQWSKSFMK